MIENIYLVEQTKEVNVRVISTKSALIGTALCHALELSDEAAIDCRSFKDDDGDEGFLCVVSEDGVNWHHIYRLYEEDEFEKLKNALLSSGRSIMSVNHR